MSYESTSRRDFDRALTLVCDKMQWSKETPSAFILGWADEIAKAMQEVRAELPTASIGLVRELEREIIRLNDEIYHPWTGWKRVFYMYRDAWLREIGGLIRAKHHDIDGFVLRTRDVLQEANQKGFEHGKSEGIRQAKHSLEVATAQRGELGYHFIDEYLPGGVFEKDARI